MRLRRGYVERKARVEMLPLIDVVFLLLVFFIYAMLSMVMHRGLKVELPGAKEAVADRRDYISVTLDKENRVFLNGRPIEKAALSERIRALRGTSKTPVFIEGDRQADLGAAVELLDLLRRAGIEEVSFSCREGSP